MVSTRSSTRSSSAAAAGGAAAAAHPASNSLEIDPVSKARTITHMNKDHAADLSALLRHRAGLSAAQAADAELLDLDLATMTIRAGAGDNHRAHTLALDPPMATWGDRRARLIDMTLEARKALGLPISAEEQQHASSASSAAAAAAPIKWYPPEGADLVPFTIVLLDYVASLLVWTGQLAPGRPLHDAVLARVLPAGGPAALAWTVTTAFPLFVGAHLLEMAWFDRTRLAPAGVARGTKVWAQWLGCQLVDGFATYQRWDRRILGKGKKKGDKEL